MKGPGLTYAVVLVVGSSFSLLNTSAISSSVNLPSKNFFLSSKLTPETINTY